jgi:UDP-glucose 4-epimerase
MKGPVMKILVTGGAGYIGSHTCVELINKGFDVAIVDNLSNSKVEVIRRIEKITGFPVDFHKMDILDRPALLKLFSSAQYTSVIHFAGFKAVGESVKIPLSYYYNNIAGTLTLLDVMRQTNCRHILFSSSATVYGNPLTLPIKEDFPLQPTNPYGRTKLFIEEILRDLYASDKTWRIVLLRYFNPVGAHPSGLIGEDPNGVPNNLLPYISQVAIGMHKELPILGNDYPTPDGTGVRDYIHVVDLARGHVCALKNHLPGFRVYNLGTGHGYSVLEVVKAFSRACNKKIPYVIAGRRPGDIPACYGDPTLAEKELHWRARYGIDDMCRDAWRWQQSNPNGYALP